MISAIVGNLFPTVATPSSHEKQPKWQLIYKVSVAADVILFGLLLGIGLAAKLNYVKIPFSSRFAMGAGIAGLAGSLPQGIRLAILKYRGMDLSGTAIPQAAH